MFGPYLQVLRRPGAAQFSAAGALARMQMSMAGVSAVLLVSAVRDSYALAGIVSATYAVSGALVGPQISRFIDARGQRSIVPRQLAVHLPAMAALIALAVFTPLNWPIVAMAFVAGASQPNVGPLVRARWSAMLSGTPQLRTAFAWESLIDEAVFIVGPVLATFLALQLFPSSAIIVATLFLAIGLFFLVRQVGTEPAPSGNLRGVGGRSAILLPGLGGIVAISVLLGGVFGTLEVATLATTKALGQPGTAGGLLALYAFGSLLSGLVFGGLNLKASLLRQYITALAALSVVSLPVVFMGSVWQLAIGMFVAGLACAPALIAGMSLVERIVPAARLTESMGWVSSGLAVGIAIAMPMAGFIADHYAPHLSYLVLSGCAIGAFVIGLAVLRALRRAQPATGPGAPADPAGVDEPLLEGSAG
ncbi:MFS transporter [Nakamurella lactea]|uniref:MFS transporter n=1 Tax=Nakamurella lactea TaxID=459515 RepID=UPI00040D6643|nr:MFS transporter [Nakamurella lactea]